MERPLISVVTPCLNRADMIAEAIESVLGQQYPEFEHIVVDGGSTDGTLDVLEQYPHLRVVSEPDQGVYDGLNKGIALAKGAVIAHLNSDDAYQAGAFEAVARRFAERPEAEVASGGAAVFEFMADGSRRLAADYSAEQDQALTYRNVLLGVPIINARFFRRTVYERLGLYDLSYRLAADREFLLRVVLEGTVNAPVGRTLYRYTQHAGSLTVNEDWSSRLKSADELMRMAENYLRRDDLPHGFRRVCRYFHGHSATIAIVSSMAMIEPRRAMHAFLRAWKSNSLWPLTLVAIAVPRLLPRAVRRRLAGYSMSGTGTLRSGGSGH